MIDKVIGTINEEKYKDFNIDYVDIDWFDAFKKLHKKTSRGGRELAIKMGNEILTKGLKQGDILDIDGNNAVVVNIKEADALVVKVDNHHLIPKVCYEIGNRHATLFYGKDHDEFITPYNEPMKIMLEKLGVKVKVEKIKFDFNKRLSSSVNAHTH